MLIQTLHDFTVAVIGQRREALTMDRLTFHPNDTLDQKHGQAFLDELLQPTLSSKQLSICEQENDNENIAGNTFYLYEISGYPTVQQVESDDVTRPMPELGHLECVHPHPSECSLKGDVEIRKYFIINMNLNSPNQLQGATSYLTAPTLLWASMPCCATPTSMSSTNMTNSLRRSCSDNTKIHLPIY